jgi:hypothetical protein
MLDGIEKGMLSSPVHDAMAINQCATEWAKEGMERLWSDGALVGKTRLKVDYPD